MRWIWISPLEAYRMLQRDREARCLDVRTPEEFREGHAVGAVNVPLWIVEPTLLRIAEEETFRDRVRDAASGTVVWVVGCSNCERSERVCSGLMREGGASVYAIRGGFGGDQTGARPVPSWRDMGLPWHGRGDCDGASRCGG